jgi:hypothetical protein
MTPWMRIVALAAVGSLIAGAALAQQQIRPPNTKSTPQAPNTPLQAPAHWGPPLEQPKESIHDATEQNPPKALKPPNPPSRPSPPLTPRRNRARTAPASRARPMWRRAACARVTSPNRRRPAAKHYTAAP